jgi:hypothetical protein
MTARMRSRILLLLGVAMVLGCARAPMGLYKGPVPAPGAITAFDPRWSAGPKESKAGAPPFLRPGTTNLRRHDIGTVEVPWQADSVVVLVYGDNRPGWRLMTTPWGLPAVMGIGGPSPLDFLWGAVNIPVMLVQGVFPKLDLFQDLISIFWTHRFTGGGEQRIAAALEKELPANFLVNTGDLVENGRRGGQWEDFVKYHQRLRTKVPFLVAPGNHERLWAPESRHNWDTVMGPPAQPGKYWFAVDLPDSVARFVFLDSEMLADPRDHYPDSTQAKLSREQVRWADSTLAVPARWKFLVLHHPLVTSGHYLSDWKYDDSSPAELRVRGQLLEICRRRGVTAVLAGHEHLYQRTFIRGRDGRGFWHITTGGGGSPLYRLSERERKAALAVTLPDSSTVTWSRARSMHHYCKLVLTRRPDPKDDTAFLVVNRVRTGGKVYQIDRVDLREIPPATGP